MDLDATILPFCPTHGTKRRSSCTGSIVFVLVGPGAPPMIKPPMARTTGAGPPRVLLGRRTKRRKSRRRRRDHCRCCCFCCCCCLWGECWEQGGTRGAKQGDGSRRPRRPRQRVWLAQRSRPHERFIRPPAAKRGKGEGEGGEGREEECPNTPSRPHSSHHQVAATGITQRQHYPAPHPAPWFLRWSEHKRSYWEFF